ncbi:MAG: hypothetical protein J0G36_13495 [Afipia sp.]|nr:hypothetical protein [Afipia sp.]
MAVVVMAVVASVFYTGAVQAAPRGPLPVFTKSIDTLLVKDGCGIGFHRLSSGVCRPQPQGPRLMRLFARKCPVGYRRNLAGKCRRD